MHSLSQLLQRCGEEQVAAICVKLSTQMVKGNQDLRYDGPTFAPSLYQIVCISVVVNLARKNSVVLTSFHYATIAEISTRLG